jgi:hypothetical protein
MAVIEGDGQGMIVVRRRADDLGHVKTSSLKYGNGMVSLSALYKVQNLTRATASRIPYSVFRS